MALSHPPLRVILAAAFGGIALLAALGTSLLAGREATRRLEASQHEVLDAAAARLAERFDQALSARWRDLRILAGLPLMRDPASSPALRRSILRQLHDSFPDYRLLAFVSPEGQVLIDSRSAIEGRDVPAWPLLRAATLGPVAEDVHEVGRPADPPGAVQPRRLLDLAMPVQDAAGRVIGVVVAQLDGRWLSVLVGQSRPGEPELLVLGRGRDVLLGPEALIGHVLPLPAPARGVVGLPDGDGFLVASRSLRDAGNDPGPGWQALARLPIEAALAPARVLRRDILLYGLGASLLAALLGWVAAAWLARPLRHLADAAARQQAEGNRDPLAPRSGFAEAVVLGHAFDGLLGDCRRSEAALAESEQRLRLAQRAGQIGAYEWDIAADTGRATREYAALHGERPQAEPQAGGDQTWSGHHAHWLARLDPEDRPLMRQRLRRVLDEGGPFALEYRIRLPDGRLRWLHDRGEVLLDAGGRPVRALGAVRDVTARRAAEDALRESEARLRLAQEAGGIGSWDLDLRSGRQVWSERHYALFGLDPALPAPDVAALAAYVREEDRATVLAARDAALAGAEGTLSMEFRIRRASDGAERWLAATGRLIRDAHGRPWRLLGVSRDITEARLREAELRAMLEASPIGVLRGDLHGRILDANDAALRLLGHDRAALASGGLRWDALAGQRAGETGIAAVREMGLSPPHEMEYRRPDGSRVPVLVGFTVIGEAREETIAFLLDLTDRKRAEAALRADKVVLEQAVAARTAELAAREGELRRIYDRTPAPFHSVDAEGRLLRVSEEWLAFLGYRREEVLGRRTGDFMPPESGARWEAALAELRETGDEVREVEYRMRRADGREVEVLLRARADHDAAGRFLLSYSVLFDMTERNRAEARLREAQKLEALGRVAGGVAHDFNNLLQVLTGALQLLADHATRPERVRRYAGVAMQAAERGAELTRRMLAFARQDRLEAAPVPLPEVMQGVATLLRGPLGPDIRLEIAVPPGLPAVRADRSHLELVLVNLALNARDAIAGSGRVRLDAAVEALGEGNPQGLAPGDYLRIRVIDSGHGMDAAIRARATEPFFTTKEGGQGSGLGLAVAHGFAAQSGGALQIESRPGEGTVVSLWLPQAGLQTDMA